MTVVINYVSDFFSIILTDRRVSYGLNGEFGYSDDAKKLINLSEMGWAAGAGLADYLTKLKTRLSKTEINSIEEIMTIYEETTNGSVVREEEYKEHIHNSVASFSFHNFDLDKQKFNFHIGLLTRAYVDEENIKAVPLNKINIFYPSDLIIDEINGPIISEKHDVFYENPNLEGVIKRLLDAFLDIYRVSKFVSEKCDLGLEIILPDGMYKMKLSGSIHDLIEVCEGNKVREKFKIISKISAS